MPRAAGVAILSTVAVLSLAACSPNDSPGEQPNVQSTAEQPVDETTAVAGGQATCNNPDAPNLAAVTLSDTGDSLGVEWSTDGTAGNETTLWSVSISNADYSSAYQIGVKAVGDEVSFYVFDLIRAGQTDLDTSLAVIEDTTVRAEVPWADLGNMTGDLSWNAVLNTDGEDQATCPDPGDDPLNPVQEILSR